MSILNKAIGLRIRNYRTNLGLTQDKLAELAGLHPTYIGQVERGEKNITIVSLEKIATSIGIPISQLFEGLDNMDTPQKNFPLLCYELVGQCSSSTQERIYRIIEEITQIKNG